MDALRWIDETDWGFGWIHPEPAWMQRAGHAFLAGDGVWVVDPIDGDGLEERIRALGTPAGVVQMLDRHPRDAKDVAARLGVPLHELPFGGVDGAPFTVLPVVSLPVWKEIALWVPEHDALLVAESLCAGPGYSAPSERVAVHVTRRVLPPNQLRTLAPEHLLLAHGEGVHGRDEVRAALDGAFDGAARRLPEFAVGQVRRLLSRSSG